MGVVMVSFLWISANQDEMLTWIGFLGDKTRPGWWV